MRDSKARLKCEEGQVEWLATALNWLAPLYSAHVVTVHPRASLCPVFCNRCEKLSARELVGLGLTDGQLLVDLAAMDPSSSFLVILHVPSGLMPAAPSQQSGGAGEATAAAAAAAEEPSAGEAPAEVAEAAAAPGAFLWGILPHVIAPKEGARRCALPSCGLCEEAALGIRLLRCTACRSSAYCCPGHQRQHWPLHQAECCPPDA